MHYLYKITNILNNKIYIGQSINPQSRWINHQSIARSGKCSQYIHRALHKYGINNFTFQIIDSALNRWQADCLEYNYIVQYNSQEYGYNIRPGGRTSFMSQQTRHKMSKAALGSKNHRYGTKHTDEWKKHMSQLLMGQKFSEEALINMSKAAKIRLEKFPHTQPIGMIGKKHTSKSIQKMSEAAKNNHLNGIYDKNKLLSDEQIQKIISDNRSSNKIAQEYHVSSSLILKIKKKAGIKYIKKEILSNEQIQEILKDNRSSRKIAQEYGVSKIRILRLKRASIQIHDNFVYDQDVHN